MLEFKNHPEPRPHHVLQSTYKSLVAPRAKARAFYPIEIARIYNFPKPVSSERVNIAVVSFGGGLFGNVDPITKILTGGDLETAWRTQGLTTFPTVKVITLGTKQNIPNKTDSATIENNLDVQIIGAFVPNSNITLIIGNSYQEIVAAAKAANAFVISVSWGFAEKGNGTDYCQRIDALLKGLVDAGINICCSAGDNGASDGQTGINVDFPGSSPYVVCCGGTSLIVDETNAYNAQTQETVWNNNATSSATGGGKSAVFPKPSYQNNIPGTQRMVPDVALVGDPNTGIRLRVGNEEITLGGTSAVSPMMASFIALTRCNTFLNPLLYAAPKSCFHDILTGNNGAPDFQAGPGYDMCSGLGSIDGVLLQSAIQSKIGDDQPDQEVISPSALFFTATNYLSPQQLTILNTQCKKARKDITWTSSDVKVATVDASGWVNAIANGLCDISCSSVPTQLVRVNVSGISSSSGQHVDATNVFILPRLHIGDSVFVGLFNTQPPNATTRTMTYTSQQPHIASVHAVTGEVTGISAGLVTILGNPIGLPAVQSVCSFQVV